MEAPVLQLEDGYPSQAQQPVLIQPDLHIANFKPV
jgi:hypothetical protein